MPKENVARKILYPTDTNILVRVAFLYVGQGAAAVVFVADGNSYRVILVDINLDRGAGGIDVVRLMKDLLTDANGKLASLDAFVNTHPHDDHICGTKELSDALDIKQVWHTNHKPSKKYGSKHPELTALIGKVKKKYGDAAELIMEGSRSAVSFGEGEFHFLSPAEHVTDDVNEEDADQRRARIHEQCGVIKFGKGGSWIIIVGDADKVAFETHIVDYHGSRLRAYALGASHHGSRTFFKDNEDDEAYMGGLKAIDPSYVVVSAPTQAESKHDHPHDDAMEIYEEYVGKENVLHTGEDRKCFIFDIHKGGDMKAPVDDDGQLAETYGLDDEDDGGDDDKSKKPESAPGVFVNPRGQSGDYAPRKYG